MIVEGRFKLVSSLCEEGGGQQATRRCIIDEWRTYIYTMHSVKLFDWEREGNYGCLTGINYYNK